MAKCAICKDEIQDTEFICDTCNQADRCGWCYFCRRLGSPDDSTWCTNSHSPYHLLARTGLEIIGQEDGQYDCDCFQRTAP